MNRKRFSFLVIFSVISVICFLTLAGDGNRRPMTVSPGCENEVAQVDRVCPTFSWTGVSGATAYQVAVFESDGRELMEYEQMVSLALPVIQKDIHGPALSWTPALKEGFKNGGVYVWFVGAVDETGSEIWSEGKMFTIEIASPYAGIANEWIGEVTERGKAKGRQAEVMDVYGIGQKDVIMEGTDSSTNIKTQAVTDGTPYVICYEHADYQGASFTLQQGQNRPDLNDFWDDRISSIKVFNGAMVTLFVNKLQDVAYANRKWLTVVWNIPHLSKLKYEDRNNNVWDSTETWNDKTSAIMWGPCLFDVTSTTDRNRYVIVFSDANYEGWQCITFKNLPGLDGVLGSFCQPIGDEEPTLDDSISSVIAKLPSDTGVKLAKHANYQSPGFFINYSISVPNLHNYGWGDCISSILFFKKK